MSSHPETNPHFVRPTGQQDDQSHQSPQPQTKRPKSSKRSQSSRPEKHVRQAPPPLGRKDQPQRRDDDDENIRQSDKDSEPPIVPHPEPHGSRVPRPTSRPHSLWLPTTQRTNFLTWFGAVFCAIFWIVVIIGGLVILIVYLVFRPRSPRFDVSTATLNAAYLDMGNLLNADLTVLANFTNPNKKMSVDFSYLTIELYYGKTLIAKQFLESFSAAKAQTKFAYLHMVTSQVRLPILEVRRLNRQMETSEVVLEVKGYFRARSNFGSLLRYSYWLHGQCTIIVTRPPDGTLIASKCKTKH